MAKPKAQSSFPDVITRLPQAECKFNGAKAWIHQGISSQLVFFQFEAGMDLPSHSHTYPQWGIVIDGEMEMKIAGEPHVFKKGDEYLVPPGAAHSARFLQPTRVMDFFSEKNRYRPK